MRITILIIAYLILLTGCNKNKLTSDPSYNKLEEYIRKEQDPRATFTYNQYERILTELLQNKYLVVTVNKFKDTIDTSKVVICMRHDIDCHPFKALEMAAMENQYGISATYYVLATSNYYGKINSKRTKRYQAMETVYKQLANLRHEIGIHNDLLTILIKYKRDPLSFNREEINFYNSLGIKIFGTVAHGSNIAQKTVPNFEIFSDYCEHKQIEYEGKQYNIGDYSLKGYGFTYEANFINHNAYYSESGGIWNLDGGYDELMLKLKESKTGDRIQILTHPVWWGKE